MATVSHLISGGITQTIPLEPQENAIASGLLWIANRVSGSVHREALERINLHCETAFCISGYGQTWLYFDKAEVMAKARGIQFAGLSEPQGHRLAGIQLVILDSDAGINVCCDYSGVVPGTEHVCDRTLSGVGGAHRAMCEADCMMAITLNGGGKVRFK